MRSLCFVLIAAVAGLCLSAGPAQAQQVTVGTPFHSGGDSFFERTGVNWGMNWNNGFFRFGAPNMGAPQFGGYDPNAGIQGGFAWQRDNMNGFFNFAAGQGFRQNLVSQTPSVTLTNGQPGFISDTSQSPFVISQIPVVGGWPMVPNYAMGSPYPGVYYPGPSMMAPSMGSPGQGNHRVQALRQQMAAAKQAADNAAAQMPEPALLPPAQEPRRAGGGLNLVAPPAAASAGGPLAAAQSSSAGQAVPSVAEARRLHQEEQSKSNREAEALCIRAQTAVDGGKPNVAKVYYRMALQRATGPMRTLIQARLDVLHGQTSPGQ